MSQNFTLKGRKISADKVIAQIYLLHMLLQFKQETKFQKFIFFRNNKRKGEKNKSNRYGRHTYR